MDGGEVKYDLSDFSVAGRAYGRSRATLIQGTTKKGKEEWKMEIICTKKKPTTYSLSSARDLQLAKGLFSGTVSLYVNDKKLSLTFVNASQRLIFYDFLNRKLFGVTDRPASSLLNKSDQSCTNRTMPAALSLDLPNTDKCDILNTTADSAHNDSKTSHLSPPNKLPETKRIQNPHPPVRTRENIKPVSSSRLDMDMNFDIFSSSPVEFSSSSRPNQQQSRLPSSANANVHPQGSVAAALSERCNRKPLAEKCDLSAGTGYSSTSVLRPNATFASKRNEPSLRGASASASILSSVSRLSRFPISKEENDEDRRERENRAKNKVIERMQDVMQWAVDETDGSGNESVKLERNSRGCSFVIDSADIRPPTSHRIVHTIEDDDEFKEKEEEPKKAKYNFRGLVNPHNHCYMNSVLQVVCSRKGFYERITKCLDVMGEDRTRLFQLLRSVCRRTAVEPEHPDNKELVPMRNEKLTNLRVHMALYNASFKETGQQDAQELFSCLLDAIDEECLGKRRGDRMDYDEDSLMPDCKPDPCKNEDNGNVQLGENDGAMGNFSGNVPTSFPPITPIKKSSPDHCMDGDGDNLLKAYDVANNCEPLKPLITPPLCGPRHPGDENVDMTTVELSAIHERSILPEDAAMETSYSEPEPVSAFDDLPAAEAEPEPPRERSTSPAPVPANMNPANLFKLDFIYSRTCDGCGKVSSRDEHEKFHSISVQSCQKEKPSLQFLFNNSLNAEHLEVKCEKCSSRTATQTVQFRSKPSYLVLLVKRYGYDTETLRPLRIDVPIEVDEFLDLSPFLLKETKSVNENTLVDLCTPSVLSRSPRKKPFAQLQPVVLLPPKQSSFDTSRDLFSSSDGSVPNSQQLIVSQKGGFSGSANNTDLEIVRSPSREKRSCDPNREEDIGLSHKRSRQGSDDKELEIIEEHNTSIRSTFSNASRDRMEVSRRSSLEGLEDMLDDNGNENNNNGDCPGLGCEEQEMDHEDTPMNTTQNETERRDENQSKDLPVLEMYEKKGEDEEGFVVGRRSSGLKPLFNKGVEEQRVALFETMARDRPQIANQFLFRPVTEEWHKLMRSMTGIRFFSRSEWQHLGSIRFFSQKNSQPKKLKEVRGDGNCMFRKMKDDDGTGEWGTQFELGVAATMLGVSIYTYHKRKGWLVFHPMFTWNDGSTSTQSLHISQKGSSHGIYLDNSTGCHYDVVLSVEDNSPDKCDLENNGNPYSLVGVINHFGRTVHSGHYRADVLVSDVGGEEKWLNCDDEKCEETQVDKVLKNAGTNGYLLVYRRQDLKNE